MSKGYRLLQLIADGRFHSGEALAESMGITRTAVWKRLQALREELDLEVDAVPGKGYRLARPLEFLERERILGALTPEIRDRVARLDIHQQIDSTNTWLLQQALAGAPSGSICLAERQMAGRGRRGRSWVSPYGSNIYLSVLWRSGRPPAQLSGLSLVTGLATHRALRALGVERIGLKWPNDILYGRRKLAGLLLEMAGEAEGPSHVVLGVGVNVRMPERSARAIDQPWVDLDTLVGSESVSRNQLVSVLIEQILQALAVFERAGLQPFVGEWHQHDCLLGQPVVLHSPQSAVEGVHRGIDGNGALLLEQAGVVRRFHAGELSLRAKP